jgi:secretion/DNA translocation related TadE-like protein
MRRTAGQGGSVSVVAAGVLVVLLVCTMGIADVARALRARSQMRTAADAAALAAAQELAVPSGQDPAAIASVYADRNGAVLVACTCVAGSAEALVTVRTRLDGLWFVPGPVDVTADARAVVDLP